MGYTFAHRPTEAIGVEKDSNVVALWESILQETWDPHKPALGSKTSQLFARLLTFSEHSLTSKQLTVTSRMLRDWEFNVRRAKDLAVYARHAISYSQGTYSDLGAVEATWFVDPPYQKANRRGYACGASGLDFEELAEWCKNLPGQVIVCEQEGADWLPFRPLYDLKSHRGSVTREVIWTNF